jgi:hypothetical protein
LPGALAESERVESSPFDLTMPQKVASSRPPESDDGRSRLVPVAPMRLPRSFASEPPFPMPGADATARAPRDPAPPDPAPRDPAPPDTAARPAPPDPFADPGAPREGARRRVPIRVQPRAAPARERDTLRDRLTRPLALVGVGLLVSLVDFALRQADISLPVRPSWLAAILVIAGVVWTFFVVLVPRQD